MELSDLQEFIAQITFQRFIELTDRECYIYMYIVRY